MWIFRTLCCCLLMGAMSGAAVPRAATQYPIPDPKVMSYELPNQIKWKVGPDGVRIAVLYGNPSKTGLYVMLVKWEPHTMSHPHYHMHDQYITVLKGTWWNGWGRKFDPNHTFPMPTGSYVVHYGHEIHWDGAKNSEVILEIVGEGPATATPVKEEK